MEIKNNYLKDVPHSGLQLWVRRDDRTADHLGPLEITGPVYEGRVETRSLIPGVFWGEEYPLST